jgi:superfamily II DNA or RNA helicase
MNNILRFCIGAFARSRNSSRVQLGGLRAVSSARNHQMSIRPYQSAGLAAIEKNYKAGIRRQLVVMPTGTGKTVLFAHVPEVLKRLGISGQVMVLAHRKELISQAADKVGRWNPGATIGCERAEDFADPNADVVIGSVPTLGRKDGKRLRKFDPTRFAAIVCDEAHHATAETYQRVFEYFGFGPLTTGSPQNVQPGGPLLLGVSATPQRGDDMPLGTVFQAEVFNYPLRKAIEEGWLVDLKAFRVRTGEDISHVKTTAGDFNSADLNDAINTEARNQTIVKSWLQHAEARQSLAFCEGISHAQSLAEMFRRNGVNATAIWDGDKERDAKIEAYRRGEIQVVTNCGILTEGFDCWRIGCILMARPTKSTLLYTQMVGRGTRLEDGVENLHRVPISHGDTKRDCILLDFVDNVGRHRIATSSMLFDLPETLALEGESLLATKKELEAHPQINFSGLRSLDEIETYVDAVDIFDYSVPPELETASLRWQRINASHYVLSYEDRDDPTKSVCVHLKQTSLGDWLAYRADNSLLFDKGFGFAEAIKRVENTVREQKRAAFNVLNRRAGWNEQPATEAQLKYFAREWRKRNPTPIPLNITKGQASAYLQRCWNHAA